jgi:hypothetical protein
MKQLIAAAAAKRLQGERPSPIHAAGVAVAIGASAAVIAYRAMRSAE